MSEHRVKFKAEHFRQPMNSRMLTCRIEKAFDCDGLACGIWNPNFREDPPAVEPHMHLVLMGLDPRTSPVYVSCFESEEEGEEGG